jgi:hypothetical protein
MKYNSEFIIVNHNADKAGFHQDIRFRLPQKSDWISFAVKKGVPLTAGKKVLAIETTIHTEKEAKFTGIIKSGYGKGKITKVDSGSCVILKFNDKHILIELKGNKYKGIYHFINTGVTDKKYNNTFFLFKS